MAEYPVPLHGDRRRYAGSRTRPPCRCPACTKANSDYQARYRHHFDHTQPRLFG